MTYSELALSGVVFAVVLDLVVLRTGLLRSRAFWLAYAIMLSFQLIVNGLLTGLPIVRYNPKTITGLRLAHAPVEDLGFGFALIVCSLAPWVRLTRPKPAASDRP